MFHRCIDHFLLPKSCVSLTFSANGCFLATAHVDDLGIYLWNNRSLYTQVSLRSLEADFQPKTAPLPGSAVRSCTTETEGNDQLEDDEDQFTSPEQIADSLVTLSLLPESRWKNLLSLDAIKVHQLNYFLNLYHFLYFVNSAAINLKRHRRCRSLLHFSSQTQTASNRVQILLRTPNHAFWTRPARHLRFH